MIIGIGDTLYDIMKDIYIQNLGAVHTRTQMIIFTHTEENKWGT